MVSPDSKVLSVGNFWGPRKCEPPNVSRVFWMRDDSCKLCYDCDSQFTLFNRRHHCRICGKVFCSRCTTHSIPSASEESNSVWEEKVRVCNFCFSQWEQGLVTAKHETGGASSSVPSSSTSAILSSSPSAISLVSFDTSFTGDSTSTVGSMAYPTGSYEHITYGPSINLEQSSQIGQHNQAFGDSDPNSMNSYLDVGDLSLDDNSYGFFVKRNGTEEYSNGEYYGASTSDENDHIYRSCKGEINGEGGDRKVISSLSSVDSEYLETIKASVNEPVDDSNINETEAPVYESSEVESVDSEKNADLWDIPPPEDKDADIEADLSEDRESDPFDDEDDGDAAGEWGYQSSSSSVAGGELQQREKANEEHRRALKNVVRGHLRALITQLLQGQNLPFQDDYDKDCWLEIITNLSWDAAFLLKPDMTKGSGMDPCGYVKVKCLACGKRSDSVVIKGVVCKKNVAHRRMTAKFDRPRLLILGGALEYQRVSNHLSSFDTLLQQEMDHLKMAVTKISAHNPNILLVEKSVSRFAQEYLLEKNISLVLNIKRPLLERIARCTGAEILPSLDSSQSLSVKKMPILGKCDSFHVEKYFEEHGSADQGGKKLTKTLMFFEGCPKPLGCTILLKGAPGDELKKVKHVVQLGIFAAYQLAVETSYLADERVMPELSLKSPINVALPDETLNINRSISTVSDLVTPTSERLLNENSQLISQVNSSIFTNTVPMSERCQTGSMMTYNDSLSSSMQSSVGDSSRSSSHEVPKNMFNDLSQDSFSEFTSKIGVNQFPESHITSMNLYKCLHDDYAAANSFNMSGSFGHDVGITNNDGNALTEHDPSNPGNLSDSNSRDLHENVQPLKEEFPASPTDDKKSILVSLTTRCVSKGDVCERAHLFRIQYYRNFDKPLGRFLQDDLFDQSYLCRVCEMPPEAHIHCYTHQQGSLTISVKRNPRGPLPGESKGKIWMWHRCCRCPRMRGCPPATRRVPMSDAAWGLSFGKFLELSFSNHAAASRVASCGHSLHKDCLRFYGCGWMVACFRYAPIIVHSVYLPPSKLEFTCTNLEWIEKEANEVRNQAGELYDKVCNVINEISDKYLRSGLLESSTKACGLRKHITELETKLKEEKEYFEESLKRAFERQAGIDILEINKLRRHLLIDSYKWDQILIDTDAKITQEETPNGVEKTNMDGEPAKEVGSCGSIISDGKIEINNGQGLNIKHSSEQDSCSGNIILDQETMCKEKGDVMPNGVNMGEADPVNSNNSVRRVISAGQLPIVGNSSVIIESIESAWVCGKHSGSVKPNENDTRFSSEKHIEARDEMDIHRASSLALPSKSADSLSNSTSWLKVPFINIYQSPEKSTSLNAQKLDAIGHYNPKFVTSFRELVCPGGARLLFSVGFDNTVVPVYDDEPTSIIAYALVSPEYQTQMSDDPETKKDGIESTISLPSTNSVNSLPEAVYAQMRSFRSSEESLSSMAGSRSSANLDPSFYTKAVHARVHFSDNGLLGKVNYTVTCYFAKRFEALRKISCPTEMDFIRSLSRCKKWGAQGGKSNVFFAKTLDDRFIIKQVTKTELDSFFKFAPDYFKYLSESINSSSPTCLAKILGIFQVTSKHMKGGREYKMDVLVMENLLFRRNVKILYDLKGSCRSRYNPNSSGGNNVLLDQNLLQTMSTSPIFVGNKAKRLLERAVWNDTSFLASIHVMDYSLLVGIDEEKRELVVGIIDFMRQYTWDKHLETWVKASGILGGPKNAQPTVISPDQYKKRFRKAMTTYFIMVPDQWTPPTIIPAELSDPSEENSTILASP